MGFIVKFLASITLVLIAVLSFIYSGIFNVSAQWDDPEWLRWILASTREESVEARAENIKSPTLGSETQIVNGFRSYREMCAVCHTPPGGTDSPIKQGLNPTPPNLAAAEDHAMSEAELFWVIKNGIRMTGMPAWGPSHDDAEIWSIVAFLKALPTIDADEYKRLDAETKQGHGHSGAVDKGISQEHMEKPVDAHGTNKIPAPTPAHMDSKAGHMSSSAPQSDNHSVVIEDNTPIEYIDNGTHAH